MMCSALQVNSSARGGVRFVASVIQQAGGGGSGGGSRVSSPNRGCRSPPRSPPRTPPGERDLENGNGCYSPGEVLGQVVFLPDWLKCFFQYVYRYYKILIIKSSVASSHIGSNCCWWVIFLLEMSHYVQSRSVSIASVCNIQLKN